MSTGIYFDLLDEQDEQVGIAEVTDDGKLYWTAPEYCTIASLRSQEGIVYPLYASKVIRKNDNVIISLDDAQGRLLA